MKYKRSMSYDLLVIGLVRQYIFSTFCPTLEGPFKEWPLSLKQDFSHLISLSIDSTSTPALFRIPIFQVFIQTKRF